uniref:Uncharacterized protein n=1 Tax=Nelumbo nucifera TaxID=4432 RepID=A0A822Z039_NELNU|nr:TPA_asm: hypothetical protein HUJ06_008494 [Nelumbo nucifera]
MMVNDIHVWTTVRVKGRGGLKEGGEENNQQEQWNGMNGDVGLG